MALTFTEEDFSDTSSPAVKQPEPKNLFTESDFADTPAPKPYQFTPPVDPIKSYPFTPLNGNFKDNAVVFPQPKTPEIFIPEPDKAILTSPADIFDDAKMQANFKRVSDAEAEATYKAGLAQNPISKVARAAGRGGKLLEAAVGDVLNIPMAIKGYTKPFENIKAYMDSPETDTVLPIEQLSDEMGGIPRFLMKATLALPHMEPKLAAGFFMGAAGAPAMVSAGLPMLITDKGEVDPIGAAIAAGLPGVTHVGEKLVANALAKIPISKVVLKVVGQDPMKLKGKVVQNLGGLEISNDTFRKFLETGGGFLAANAYLLAAQTPQILSLPPEQRAQATFDTMAQSIAPSLLGFIRPGLSKSLESKLPEIAAKFDEAMRPAQKPALAEPPTIGEPNASDIPSPTSVPQPEIRPSMGETTPLRQPGETAVARPEEAPAFTPPAQDNTPVVQGQGAIPLNPDMATARRLVTMTPAEFLANAQNFNKVNLELGRNASPADYEELKQLRDKAIARLQTTMDAAKSGDQQALRDMAPLASLPQFYNEAIAEYENQLKKLAQAPAQPKVGEQKPSVPPVSELSKIVKVDVKSDPRLDEPGITRKSIPNRLILQMRDLQSHPIGEVDVPATGDPLTDSKTAEALIRKQAASPGVSLRESTVTSTGPNGMAIYRYAISPNGVTWTTAQQLVDARKQRTEKPASASKPNKLKGRLPAKKPAVAKVEKPAKVSWKVITIRQQAAEFNQLVKEHAPKQKWVQGQDLDNLFLPDPGKSNLGSVGIQGAIARGKALQKAQQQAARDLGLDPAQIGKEAYRAKHLDRLKKFIGQVDKFTEATKDTGDEGGKIDVPVAELKVGESLIVDGEPVKVIAVHATHVELEDGRKFGKQTVPTGETLYVEGYEPKDEAKPAAVPTAKGSELNLGNEDFKLTSEKQKFVEPTSEKTGFGDEALTQNDLFKIAEITKEVDPFKSANAAEKMYGGAKEAVKRIEGQLATMAKDPKAYKSFDKVQRARLQEVLNVLRERAQEAKPKTEVKKPLENLTDADQTRVAELKATLLKKLGQVSIGVDPEILSTAVELANLYAKGGVKTFEQFARKVHEDMPSIWDRIKIYLRNVWNQIAEMFGFEEATKEHAEAIFADIEKGKLIVSKPNVFPPGEPKAIAPVKAESAGKAQITFGSSKDVDATKPEIRLVMSHGRSHFTLWLHDTRKKRQRWEYLTILGSVKDEAIARAKAVAERLAVGDTTGIAFFGKQAWEKPNTIGIYDTPVTTDELMAIEKDLTPVGEQTLTFGKLQGTKVKDAWTKDPGWSLWAAENMTSGRNAPIGNYLRSHPDYRSASDARNVKVESQKSAAIDAVNPESLAILQGQQLGAEATNDGYVKITGKTYEWKDTIKSIEGRRWDEAASAWKLPAAGFAEFVRKLAGLPKSDAKRQGVGIPKYQRDERLGTVRKNADARSDQSGFTDAIGNHIGDDTKALIERGLKIGMPGFVVDEQVEDVARINRAYKNGKRLFILASEPGSGKTFVLGGAIRELQKAGAKKIGYVTLRQELITQIKQDLADFGIDDVRFITYPEMRKISPEDLDVLIFDEAHAIKNVKDAEEGGAQQAAKAAQWISKAKFTILSSATPFENPVQAVYLEPTGVYDEVFGDAKTFAEAYGASSRTFKIKTPRGEIEKTELVWRRTTTSDQDSKAVREFYRKEGVFTSRKIRLPKGAADSRMVSITIPENAAAIYRGFDESAEELEDSLPKISVMWVTNFKKRLLEASKVQTAIDEAEDALKRGRWPIIFVETKAERKFNIPELLAKEANYKAACAAVAAARARGMDESYPKRADWGLPPEGIPEVLGRFMEKTGLEKIEIPSAADLIINHFGKDKVDIFMGPTEGYPMTPQKAQQNLDRWRASKTPRVILATMAKGGTGLSLHDKVGNHQTTQINANLPWTASQVVQVAQRSARYGIKGTAEMVWLFADNIPFDRFLSSRVGGRMADMGSIVHGAKLEGAENIEDFNFEDRPFSEINSEVRDETKPQLAETKHALGSPVTQPIAQAAAAKVVTSTLGSVPSNVTFINDPDAPRGQAIMVAGEQAHITLNLAKLDTEQAVADTLREELIHSVWENPVIADARETIEQLVTEVDRQRQAEEGYDPNETQEEAANERARRIFDDAQKANIFLRAWRAIVAALKKLFGFQPSADESARAAAKTIMREVVKNQPTERGGIMWAEPPTEPQEGNMPDNTQVSGKQVGILSKTQMPSVDRQIAYAQKAFTDYGLPVEKITKPDPRLPGQPLKTQFKLKPDGQNHDAVATKLADDLDAELAKGDQANTLLLSNLTTSLANSIADGDANVIGDDGRPMISEPVQERLFTLAQTPASQAGQLLSARGQHSFDPEGELQMARNVAVNLRKIWGEALGGEEINGVMRKLLKKFDDYFTPKDVDDALDPLKLLPTVRDLVKRILESPRYRLEDIKADVAAALVKELGMSGADAAELSDKIYKALEKPLAKAKEQALEQVQKELSPPEKKVFAKGKTLWQKIERAVRAGLFDSGTVLEDLAKKQGWTIPTASQKAQIKAWAEEEERLRTPTQRQLDKFNGDVGLATTEAENGTEQERIALIRKIQADWSRWSMPVKLAKWFSNSEIAKNNAKAVNEFVGANLLFKAGFAVRQFWQVVPIDMALNSINRTIAHALERAANDGGFSPDTIKDLWSAGKEMGSARLASFKATLRTAERTLKGHSARKVLERMNHSIGIFERALVKADEMEAKGNKAGALAFRLFTVLRAGYRVAEIFDAVQALGLEWQEMRQQLSTELRKAGKSRAEIEVTLDDVFGNIKLDMEQAITEAQMIADERGITKDKATLQADAWRLVRAQAYGRMRAATGQNTDYQAENEVTRELYSWNLPETGGVGGVIAGVMKGIKRETEKVGVPTGGMFSFGNAMGIAANRMLTFSGGGLFGGWGFGDSPWYQGERNKRQRRLEAIQGLSVLALLAALVAAGKAIIQTQYPKDKDEKEKFIAEGHKLNTVRFVNDDGSWVETPITQAPLNYISAPLYMMGALQQIVIGKEREQARMNAEAKKKGLIAGKVDPVGVGDVMSVLAQGAYGLLTGGRTASGKIQSFSDYGNFNLNQAAASTLTPYIPTLPAWQEASRAMGVAMDTRTATMLELLVPSPWNAHQRVNSLGDPLANQNDVMRVVQVMTGGFGAGKDTDVAANNAYQQLFNANYATPQINPSKGYNFNGTIRQMTPQELENYTVSRGKAFKQELSGVDTSGMSESEARKVVQAAYQRANSRALQALGVDSATSSTSASPASQGAAQRAVPRRISGGRVRRLSLGRPPRRTVGLRRIRLVRLRRPVRSRYRPLRLNRVRFGGNASRLHRPSLA